jgi:glutaredoxin
MNSTEDYNKKYIKYKQKYNELKKVEARLILEGKLNADGSLKIQNGGASPVVSLYKAEWCGHCNTFKSTWNQLQKTIKHVKFETFDADNHGDIIKSQNIQGFPTIKINGHEYHGERDFETLRSILNGTR